MFKCSGCFPLFGLFALASDCIVFKCSGRFLLFGLIALVSD